jgi:hypothetical protein
MLSDPPPPFPYYLWNNVGIRFGGLSMRGLVHIRVEYYTELHCALYFMAHKLASVPEHIPIS